MTSGDRKRDWKQEQEERRQAEMAKGAQIVAQHFLSARFNPDHVPETHPVPVSPSLRQRRDEYRNRMGAQVNKS